MLITLLIFKTLMNKLILFLASILLLTSTAFAQSYAVQRGHAQDDLYVFCRKNISTNSEMQLYHLWDYGKKISVQYTIGGQSVDNDLNLKNFVADSMPGLLFCTSLSNADTSIYKSIDAGKTWEHMPTLFTGLTPPIALLGGSVTGEIILTERPAAQRYSIGSTTDYFVTHLRNALYNSYFTKPEVGIESGEIYGLNNTVSSTFDFLLHSQDFGITIDTILIDSVAVYKPAGKLAHKICHGSLPGELFLITREPEQSGFPNVFKIYYSSDYGANYVYKNELKFDSNSSFTEFSGGRENCSFYVVNWKYDPLLERQILQVFHSADCGSTFNLHEHELNATVDIAAEESEVTTGLTISPNPTSGFAVISYISAINEFISVEIFTTEGQKMQESEKLWQPSGSNQTIVYTNHLPNGSYVVNVISGKRIIASGRLLVNH